MNPERCSSIAIDDVEIVIRRAFAIHDARKAEEQIQTAYTQLLQNRDASAVKVSFAELYQSLASSISLEALESAMRGHAQHLALQESSHNQRKNRREQLLLPPNASTETVEGLETMLKSLKEVLWRCNSEDEALSPILRLYANPEIDSIDVLDFDRYPPEVVESMFVRRATLWRPKEKSQHPLVIRAVRQVLDLGVGLVLVFAGKELLNGKRLVQLSIQCNRQRTFSIFYDHRLVSSFSYDHILRIDSMH